MGAGRVWGWCPWVLGVSLEEGEGGREKRDEGDIRAQSAGTVISLIQ